MLRNIPIASAKTLVTLTVGATLRAHIRHWWHAHPERRRICRNICGRLFHKPFVIGIVVDANARCIAAIDL